MKKRDLYVLAAIMTIFSVGMIFVQPAKTEASSNVSPSAMPTPRKIKKTPIRTIEVENDETHRVPSTGTQVSPTQPAYREGGVNNTTHKTQKPAAKVKNTKSPSPNRTSNVKAQRPEAIQSPAQPTATSVMINGQSGGYLGARKQNAPQGRPTNSTTNPNQQQKQPASRKAGKSANSAVSNQNRTKGRPKDSGDAHLDYRKRTNIRESSSVTSGNKGSNNVENPVSRTNETSTSLSETGKTKPKPVQAPKPAGELKPPVVLGDKLGNFEIQDIRSQPTTTRDPNSATAAPKIRKQPRKPMRTTKRP